MTREPTFVIAGGQRCGTTWLAHLLDEHPDVWIAKPLRPEPKFFLEEPRPGRDRDWYLSTWFQSAGDQRALGEKSTSYIECAQAPQRMDALFPGLRVVFILRHPVERAISNYCFSRQNRLEDLPFADAIRAPDRTPAAATSVDPFAYLQRGHYAEQLEHYRAALGCDRIAVVVREQLREAPAAVLPGLFAFLGVDPAFAPAGVDRTHNTSSWQGVTLTAALLDELLAHFRASNRRLEADFGVDVSHWDEPTATLRALLR